MKRSGFILVLLTAVLLFSSIAARAQPTYSLAPIEAEQTAEVIRPIAMNNKGEIVAIVGNSSVLWRDGRTVILPQPGGDVVFAVAINDRSDILVDDVLGSRGFVFPRGDLNQPVEIVIPGSAPAGFFDMNNRGDIIGATLGESVQPFVRDASGDIVFLDVLPGHVRAFPGEINERGDVVGTSFSQSDQDFRAVLWRDGVVQSLGVLPGTVASDGVAINNSGQVAGTAYRFEDFAFRPFVWQQGELIALPSPGFIGAPAWDINDLGQIVGESPAQNFVESSAILWDKGVAYDLNSLILAADPLKPFVRLIFANLINDEGQIVAWGTDSRGPFEEIRPYLLTPSR